MNDTPCPWPQSQTPSKGCQKRRGQAGPHGRYANLAGVSLDNFVDPVGGNLHLQRDSIALDQGVDSGLVEIADIDGQTRMYPPDVGGDENNPGDVTGDGIADLMDIIVVLQILSGHVSNPDSIYLQADVDGDGTLNLPDALSLLRIVAAL